MNLSKLKNYYDYDAIEYSGIGDVKDLFDLSIDEDYYKPIKTNSVFNSSYSEYKSKRDKNKIDQLKNILRWLDHFKRNNKGS